MQLQLLLVIYRDASARAFGVELLGGSCAGVEATRGDVHLGTVLHEAVGHHLADAAAPARDHHHFVLHVEEFVEAERAHESSLLTTVGGVEFDCEQVDVEGGERKTRQRKHFYVGTSTLCVLHRCTYTTSIQPAIIADGGTRGPTWSPGLP